MKHKCLHFGWIACLLLLMGCYEKDCSSGPSQIDITGISVHNIQFEGKGYSNTSPLEKEGEVVYEDYGLTISFQASYYGATERPEPSFSLFPAAYACEPPLPQPSEEIADIAIFSNADYVQANSSKVLPAGDTLNNLFNIYDYYSGRITGLADFLVDDHLQASDMGLVLRLVVSPAASQKHQFTLHYRLDNGEFYTFTAAPVILIP